MIKENPKERKMNVLQTFLFFTRICKRSSVKRFRFVRINQQSFLLFVKRSKRFLSIDETSRTDWFILFANVTISSIGSTKADEPITNQTFFTFNRRN
jgi:hypothetical protein